MYKVGVINTNRINNSAYVYVTNEKTGFSTNTVLWLDKVEELFRCKFDDGSHPFVTAFIDSFDWDYYYMPPNEEKNGEIQR